MNFRFEKITISDENFYLLFGISRREDVYQHWIVFGFLCFEIIFGWDKEEEDYEK